MIVIILILNRGKVIRRNIKTGVFETIALYAAEPKTAIDLSATC